MQFTFSAASVYILLLAIKSEEGCLSVRGRDAPSALLFFTLTASIYLLRVTTTFIGRKCFVSTTSIMLDTLRHSILVLDSKFFPFFCVPNRSMVVFFIFCLKSEQFQCDQLRIFIGVIGRMRMWKLNLKA